MRFEDLPESTLEILENEFSLPLPILRTLRNLEHSKTELWGLVTRRITELSKLTAGERAIINGENKAVLRKRDQEKAALQETQRFFNLRSSRADFGFWGKVPLWSLEEAVSLSFGRSPELVRISSVVPFIEISPFAAGFMNRCKLVNRALGAGHLQNPVVPAQFIKWAERVEVLLPDELLSEVSGCKERSEAQSQKSEENSTGAAASNAKNDLSEEFFLDESITPTEPETGTLKKDRGANEWQQRVLDEHSRRSSDESYKKKNRSQKARILQAYCKNNSIQNAWGLEVSYESVLSYMKQNSLS